MKYESCFTADHSYGSFFLSPLVARDVVTPSNFMPVDSETNMAASQTVPELGGYDYEFTVTVPDRCECLVCHLPMKDPVQIVGCGHRLCNICMESLLR